MTWWLWRKKELEGEVRVDSSIFLRDWLNGDTIWGTELWVKIRQIAIYDASVSSSAKWGGKAYLPHCLWCGLMDYKISKSYKIILDTCQKNYFNATGNRFYIILLLTLSFTIVKDNTFMIELLPQIKWSLQYEFK